MYLPELNFQPHTIVLLVAKGLEDHRFNIVLLIIEPVTYIPMHVEPKKHVFKICSKF